MKALRSKREAYEVIEDNFFSKLTDDNRLVSRKRMSTNLDFKDTSAGERKDPQLEERKKPEHELVEQHQLSSCLGFPICFIL